MIAENSDGEALIAQGDIDRFFLKVIAPALAEFKATNDIPPMEMSEIEDYLEAARLSTHNAFCHEMRRSFALLVGAMFERQLRSWLLRKMPARIKEIESIGNLPKLLELVDEVDSQIRVNSQEDIDVLYLVANAVRHGNGSSATKLFHTAPNFWAHMQQKSHSNWQSDLVDNMRIGDADLERFALAVMRFWHSAGASSILYKNAYK
jgi:hypothetical protein